MRLEIETAPITLATFDRACQAIGHDPDEVRCGDAPVRLAEADLGRLLDVLIRDAQVPSGRRAQVGERLARQWFRQAMAQIREATQAAAEQAETAGVLEVMKQQGASGKELSRVLTSLDPGDYEKVWHEWPIRRALLFIMSRSVDHISENLDDYL